MYSIVIDMYTKCINVYMSMYSIYLIVCIYIYIYLSSPVYRHG